MRATKPGADRTHTGGQYRRDFKANSAERCGACAKEIQQSFGPGPPLKHCATERCTRIYYSGFQRKHCQRCRSPLPRGRAYQRAAICGACFVDLCDLAGLQEE